VNHARRRHNEKWTDKSVDAIKNSADDVPEGKSTILDAPVCKWRSRIAIWAITERSNFNKVSMKRKRRRLRLREELSIYTSGAKKTTLKPS
jgi:hypothetical protein